MQSAETNQRTKFSSLESCRGICAVLVALTHLSFNGYFYDLAPVRNGGLGVVYFFVLSGFVMMHAYGHLSQKSDFWPFVVRRFGRIYPLHIFILLVLIGLEFLKLFLLNFAGVSAGVAPFEGANSLWALAGNVTLLNGMGFFKDFTWNGPSWTISTEFWVYLLFFGVLMARSRTVLFSLLIIFLSGSALQINAFYGTPIKTIEGAGAILCAYCFFIGMITYILRIRFPWNDLSLKIGELLAVFLLVMALWGYTPLNVIFNPLIFSFAIFMFSFEKGLISRFLKNRALLFLGTISYSIYMVHFTLSSLLNGGARVLESKFGIKLFYKIPGSDEFYVSFGARWHMDLVALIYLASIIVASTITYRFIEVPFRSYFGELAHRLSRRNLGRL